MAIAVESSPSGRGAVVHLLEAHDIGTAVLVRRVLDSALGQARVVVVDLSECSLLDATIMGVIVGRVSRAAACGQRLCLYGAYGVVLQALTITGIWHALRVDLSEGQQIQASEFDAFIEGLCS